MSCCTTSFSQNIVIAAILSRDNRRHLREIAAVDGEVGIVRNFFGMYIRKHGLLKRIKVLDRFEILKKIKVLERVEILKDIEISGQTFVV